jgi:hypothetical protein
VDDDWWGNAMFYLPMQYVWQQNGYSGPGWENWADTAVSAGIKWTRDDAEWQHLQPDSNLQFHFYKYDTAIKVLKNKQIKIFFPLYFSTDWASSAPYPCTS